MKTVNLPHIPDISRFMVGDTSFPGPFVLLKSATKMQKVQARVVAEGCQQDKSGVVVTLSAGSGLRMVSERALIPWDQIVFQIPNHAFVPASHATIHWREFKLSGYVNNNLKTVLPPEALARFNIVAQDILKPDPEKEARWKTEQAARVAALQAETEALNKLRRARDEEVVAACQNTSLTTHQKLHVVAGILRHSQYPKMPYTGSKLPTGRTACKSPATALTSWVCYGVLHSDKAKMQVHKLCMEHQKEQEKFWRQAPVDPAGPLTMGKLFSPESDG